MFLSYSYKSSIRVEAPFHIKLGSDLRKSGKRNDTMNEQSPNMPWTQWVNYNLQPERLGVMKNGNSRRGFFGLSGTRGSGWFQREGTRQNHELDGCPESEPSHGRGMSLAESFREEVAIWHQDLCWNKVTQRWEKILNINRKAEPYRKIQTARATHVPDWTQVWTPALPSCDMGACSSSRHRFPGDVALAGCRQMSWLGLGWPLSVHKVALAPPLLAA